MRDYKQSLIVIKNDIFRSQIPQIKLYIDQIEADLKTNESNIIFNNGEEDRTIKNNKDKIKSYRDELNL